MHHTEIALFVVCLAFELAWNWISNSPVGVRTEDSCDNRIGGYLDERSRS